MSRFVPVVSQEGQVYDYVYLDDASLAAIRLATEQGKYLELNEHRFMTADVPDVSEAVRML